MVGVGCGQGRALCLFRETGRKREQAICLSAQFAAGVDTSKGTEAGASLTRLEKQPMGTKVNGEQGYSRG